MPTRQASSTIPRSKQGDPATSGLLQRVPPDHRKESSVCKSNEMPQPTSLHRLGLPRASNCSSSIDRASMPSPNRTVRIGAEACPSMARCLSRSFRLSTHPSNGRVGRIAQVDRGQPGIVPTIDRRGTRGRVRPRISLLKIRSKSPPSGKPRISLRILVSRVIIG